jgi:hypothetical protein
MAGKKSNSRRKPSMNFWLLTLSQNHVLRLAILKTSLRKKKRNNNKKNNSSSSNKPQQKTNDGLQSGVGSPT